LLNSEQGGVGSLPHSESMYENDRQTIRCRHCRSAAQTAVHVYTYMLLQCAAIHIVRQHLAKRCRQLRTNILAEDHVNCTLLLKGVQPSFQATNIASHTADTKEDEEESEEHVINVHHVNFGVKKMTQIVCLFLQSCP